MWVLYRTNPFFFFLALWIIRSVLNVLGFRMYEPFVIRDRIWISAWWWWWCHADKNSTFDFYPSQCFFPLIFIFIVNLFVIVWNYCLLVVYLIYVNGYHFRLEINCWTLVHDVLLPLLFIDSSSFFPVNINSQILDNSKFCWLEQL